MRGPRRALRPSQLPPHAALRLVWTLPITSPFFCDPHSHPGCSRTLDGQLLAAGPAGVCRLSPLPLHLSASTPRLAHPHAAAPSGGAEPSLGSDYFSSPSGSPGCSWTTWPSWNARATGKGGEENGSLGGRVAGWQGSGSVLAPACAAPPLNTYAYRPHSSRFLLPRQHGGGPLIP